MGQLYLFSSPGYFNFCGRSGQLDVLPAYHLMSLFEPLNLTQVEIPADKAKQITPFMKNVGNGYKRLYARYRLHILDFEELKDSRNLEAVYKGQVEAIDFFLDEALTQPVHSINFTSGF